MFEAVVEALLRGEPVVLPTDTVYGLCSLPREDAVRRLYETKGRGEAQPTALIARDVDVVADLLPELSARDRAVADALLPGPYTLVVGNPARRHSWLTGSSPETLGIRVPAAGGALRDVLARVEALAATSANLPGEPDPRRLEDVPARIRETCEAVDEGELPGTPSTVVDVTGDEPRVLREGAVPASEALARIAAATG